MRVLRSVRKGHWDRGILVLLACAACLVSASADDERFITVASTTSTENSGLFDHLLPRFAEASGIEVRVVAVGTGQALRMGRNGDADVVLVHDRASEEAFVEAGFGVRRYDVMYNDFVLLGPKSDPAKISEADGVAEAMRRVADERATFVSRGDDSGTHKAELRLWALSGRDPVAASGTWYRELGAGMGATLNTAAAMNAYTLADRGTWLSFRNRGELIILLENEPPLHNPYSAMLVNPERHSHVKAEDGQAFIDWLVSPEGQEAIADFRVDGQALFHPNSQPTAH